MAQVIDLEVEMLRARRLACDELVILDQVGLARWERKFEPMEEFWVVSPDFLDVHSPVLAESVAYRIRKRVPVCYFITPEYYPRFLILATEVLPSVAPRITRKVIEDFLTAVELGATAKIWMCADFNIANPCSANPCGFQIHRTDNNTILALKLSGSRVRAYAEGLRAWRSGRSLHVSDIKRIVQTLDRTLAAPS